jgi:3-(3-hydroxy-phenyl)propionate hydroxylase
VSVRFDVAIVGLGPTGATLANFCGRLGLRTVVFERSTDPHPQPRACHLDAEVARVFQQLGFEPQLHEILTTSAGMEYVDAAGRRLFTFEGFERAPLLGWPEDLVFVQPELDAMLRDGLARFPDVEVRLGADAPPLDELEEFARFVVACDGATSATRRELEVDLIDLGFDERWLVCDLMLDDPAVPALPGIIQQVCDPARLATFVPSHGVHRRWEFRLDDDEDPDPWELLAPWRVGPRHGELVRAATYRFHALVAERWRVGNVFLAGDAAHQMPPFMGQGMCSGVRDVANLAWKLAEVVDGATVTLLETYEAERRPHVERVIRMSIEAGVTLGRLAADPSDLPIPDRPDPRRWSRLPDLDLGGTFPVGAQLPQPDRLDDRLPDGWVWVTRDATFEPDDGRPVVVEPEATFDRRAVLVRPDRQIAACVD